MSNSKLGERLVALRGGLSQGEFAKKLGISRNTLGRYENGLRAPDADFLLLLVEEFGIDANWLLLGVGEPPTPKLSPRESALIANYRASPEEARRSVETTAALLAQPKKDVDKVG